MDDPNGTEEIAEQVKTGPKFSEKHATRHFPNSFSGRVSQVLG